jgi:hypothetical protein
MLHLMALKVLLKEIQDRNEQGSLKAAAYFLTFNHHDLDACHDII